MPALDGLVIVLPIEDKSDADITKPVITLNGKANIILILGSTYTDVGATANDNKDGDITASINTVNSVDTNQAGTYYVTYDVVDMAGNIAIQVKRKVIVKELNTNYIQGGTFESSADLNHWNKVSGSGHIVRANYSTGWIDNAPSDAGSYFLYGTQGSSVTVQQIIHLDTSMADEDTFYYNFSAYFGTFGEGDSIEVELEFRDTNNNLISTYSTGTQTPNGVMEHFTHIDMLPSGTNNIIVKLILKRVNGTDIDGYVDNISLRIQKSDEDMLLKFSIAPFLQLPSSNSMTVRFEAPFTGTQAKVYYKEHGSSDTYKISNASHDTDNARFMFATIENLKANQRYDYYVKNISGSKYYKTKTFQFTTYPDENSATDIFHFLAISDTQNNATYGVLRNIVEGVADYHCEEIYNCDKKLRGITISGDVVDHGGRLDQWRRDFFGQLSEITPYVPLIPATGNHDYSEDSELSNYRNMFMLPKNGGNERYYALKIGNMQIVSLDTYKISKMQGSFSEQSRITQLNWFKNKLDAYKSETGTNVVLSIFHHGCLSTMWNTGESIGSCELVRELEQFSKNTGKTTGHLFGHTHAYSRGFSRDTNHLWLNTASASGYREALGDQNYVNTYTQDYDTFSISGSQFGFTIMSINKEHTGSLTLKRYKGSLAYKSDGYAGLSPIYDTNYDALIVKNNYINSPVISDNNHFNGISQAYLEIMPNNTVNQVHWQISTNAFFSKNTTVNVWGNTTRKKNIWFKYNGQTEGEIFDSQAGKNIFKLELSKVDGKHFEQDEQRKWDKPGMNSHDSTYSPYYNGYSPVKIHFQNRHTYYWRARVRDEYMNWSEWSAVSEFIIE